MLVKVSRSRFNDRIFDITEEELRSKFEGKELEDLIALLPNDDEKLFRKIFESNAPEHQRTRRKISVCLNAEVSELEEGKVVYRYGEKEFKIEEPKNSFRVSTQLEKSVHQAFIELCGQGCVFVDGKRYDDKTIKLGVDEINLMVNITDKFFFQIYL
jgi:hypothetical protein